MTDRAEPGPGVASTPEVVGLVPAAGEGSRVSFLPGSKEVFPLAFERGSDGETVRARVACDDVLEAMRRAGVRLIYMILRNGKWDIPAYLGDGRERGINLAYLMMRCAYGVPFTLDQAYPFVRGRTVVCGFPDILLRPTDVFTPLLDVLRNRGHDVVLALFPGGDPERVDMVEVGDEGRVVRLQVKPGPHTLDFTWGAAAWGPAFTELMHDFARDRSRAFEVAPEGAEEQHLGDAIQAAVDAGLDVAGVPFADGSYVDVGVSENLLRALQEGEERSCRG